ncbi:24934_t:CDS:2, partial [Dentiscutata erythropus]
MDITSEISYGIEIERRDSIQRIITQSSVALDFIGFFDCCESGSLLDFKTL